MPSSRGHQSVLATVTLPLLVLLLPLSLEFSALMDESEIVWVVANIVAVTDGPVGDIADVVT